MNEERKTVRELKEKGEEGSKEWYKFLREDRKCGTTDGEWQRQEMWNN